MAEYNQVVVITPFTLAGAMSPVTLAARWSSSMRKRWQASL